MLAAYPIPTERFVTESPRPGAGRKDGAIQSQGLQIPFGIPAESICWRLPRFRP